MAEKKPATGVRGRLAQITEDMLSGPSPVIKPRGTAATSAPAQLARFSQDFQKLEREIAALKADKGSLQMMDMSIIDDGDFHATPLNPERVAKLQKNLQKHRQSSPAVVRKKEDGRYEFISGRHRRAALANLGHTQIQVVIGEFSDNEAQSLTSYDNIFGPDLSDYEKFKALQAIKAKLGFNQRELSDDSGLSQSYISILFAFESLPPALLEKLDASPNLFGYREARVLANLASEDPETARKAVEVLERGEENISNLAEAINLVKKPHESQDTKKERAARATPVMVRRGRHKFADIVPRGNQLLIRLADESIAPRVQEAVLELLEKFSLEDPK
jgi:ParB family chromosome partitioning protein